MYSTVTKMLLIKKKKKELVLKKKEILSRVADLHINPSHVVDKCGEVMNKLNRPYSY